MAPRIAAAARPRSLLAAALAARLAGALGAPVVIPLDKQYVPVVRNGATVAHKTAYFGEVFVGRPDAQPFTVLFDTGSGHFILPSAACGSDACAKHRRYNRAASASAQDINHDGGAVGAEDGERDEVSVVYGTGEVLGHFVREQICLRGVAATAGEEAGGESPPAAAPAGALGAAGALGPADGAAESDGVCAPVRVVLAREMTDEPFGAFRFDGVVGLGLDSLSLDPEFSLFGQFAKSAGLAEACFGYFLSRSDAVPSEIAFGGHDARRVASELQWTPVRRPELGYWQVGIRGISIAGQPLEACQSGACTAVVDTGTSLLGAPREMLRDVHVQLARKVAGNPERVNCRWEAGPELVVELDGGVRLALGPEDYSRAAAMRVVQASSNRTQVVCRASLMPVAPDAGLGGRAWILGEPVLRKYYTAYDWGTKRVGFALAKQPAEPTELEAPEPAAVHV